jgi:MFS family permease
MEQLLTFPIFILSISVDNTYLALFLTSFAQVPQGLVGPSQNTAQMFVVPQELRATTTGMAEVCWTGANAIGPLFGGILADALGDPAGSLGKQ